MTFRVGQKVVCVARTIHQKADVHPGLIVGQIYTVLEVVSHSSWKTPGLLLVEIAPRPQYVAFESLLFRPAVERKTDISFAHEILRKATKPAPATPVALHQLGSDQ